MNLRKDLLVAKCSDDKGARQYLLSGPTLHDSINQAKKANGLNAATCGKFPPSLDALHEEALAIDAEMPALQLAA